MGTDGETIMDDYLILGSEYGFLTQAFIRNGFENIFGRKDGFDVTKPETYYLLNHELKSGKYKYVVNTIGLSDTKYCEKNFDKALYVNGLAPKMIYDRCVYCGAKYIHISTGCVYDLADTPQKEDDFIVSHCNYVVSKITAEKWIGDDTLILRPRLLYGDFIPYDKDGKVRYNNILVKIKNFKAFTNKLNSFTNVQTIVDAVKKLSGTTGVYNVASSGYATMGELAKWVDHPCHDHVLDMDRLRIDNKIYLVNNVMDTSKISDLVELPDIQPDIKECYSRIKDELYTIN